MKISTHSEKEKVKCSKCGHENELDLYSVINVSENPELKNQILEHKLYGYKCSDCGRNVALSYMNTYIDEQNKIIIFVAPQSEKIKDRGEARKIFESMYPADELGMDYVKRIVRDVRALTDKIKVFDCGLDDRVIEIMKIFLALNAGEEKASPDMIFFDVDKDGKKMFVMVLDNGKVLATDFIEEMYEDFKQEFKDKIDTDISGNIEIDPIWAMALLSAGKEDE